MRTCYTIVIFPFRPKPIEIIMFHESRIYLLSLRMYCCVVRERRIWSSGIEIKPSAPNKIRWGLLSSRVLLYLAALITSFICCAIITRLELAKCSLLVYVFRKVVYDNEWVSAISHRSFQIISKMIYYLGIFLKASFYFFLSLSCACWNCLFFIFIFYFLLLLTLPFDNHSMKK